LNLKSNKLTYSARIRIHICIGCWSPPRCHPTC